MAAARPDGAILEQPGRRIAVAALIAAVAIAAGAFLVGREERPRGRGEPSPAALAYPVPPREGRIVVEVLNATGRTGLGRVATRLLRMNGMDVVSTGNADTTLTETRVIARRDGDDGARAVARVLGAAAIATAIDSSRRVDVTVLLGEDFRPVLPLHP